jgi:hypothetical protein
LTVGRTLRYVDSSAEASRDATDVLNRALAGQRDAVAGTFAQVVHRSGISGAYDVAWQLAAATVGNDLPSGAWRLEYPDIDRAPYEKRWVARFLSAYVNDDPFTGTALFQAAQADGQLTDCLLTLAGSAAATLRMREHQ